MNMKLSTNISNQYSAILEKYARKNYGNYLQRWTFKIKIVLFLKFKVQGNEVETKCIKLMKQKPYTYVKKTEVKFDVSFSRIPEKVRWNLQIAFI